MVYTRLFNLHWPNKRIPRHYLILLLIASWLIFVLFYVIPLLNTSSEDLRMRTTGNVTSYCSTYATSIAHPLWMNYVELIMIYLIPLSLILLGLIFLGKSFCQVKPKGLDLIQRKSYLERKKMTRHVLILSSTFLLLWLPWIILRIIFIWSNTKSIQHALQITYYILIVKCFIFPILYASTNASFRGSFAIYRHKRITMNNRVWTINRSDWQAEDLFHFPFFFSFNISADYNFSLVYILLYNSFLPMIYHWEKFPVRESMVMVQYRFEHELFDQCHMVSCNSSKMTTMKNHRRLKRQKLMSMKFSLFFFLSLPIHRVIIANRSSILDEACARSNLQL